MVLNLLWHNLQLDSDLSSRYTVYTNPSFPYSSRFLYLGHRDWFVLGFHLATCRPQVYCYIFTIVMHPPQHHEMRHLFCGFVGVCFNVAMPGFLSCVEHYQLYILSYLSCLKKSFSIFTFVLLLYERSHYMSIHESFVLTKFRSSSLLWFHLLNLAYNTFFVVFFHIARSFFCISILQGYTNRQKPTTVHTESHRHTCCHAFVHPHYHFRLGREFFAQNLLSYLHLGYIS